MIEKMDRDKDSALEHHSYMNLGNVFYKLGQLTTALSYYDRAQQLIMQDMSESNPTMLGVLKAKGNLYITRGDIEKAEEIFSKAVNICQTIFGEKNINTAETYRQIADLYNKKDTDKAIYYYQKAENIFEYLYGSDNINQAVILNNLGGLYERLGDMQKAEELCVRALQIKLHFADKADTLDFASIYMNLASIKTRNFKLEEAFAFLKKAYDIRVRISGLSD